MEWQISANELFEIAGLSDVLFIPPVVRRRGSSKRRVKPADNSAKELAREALDVALSYAFPHEKPHTIAELGISYNSSFLIYPSDAKKIMIDIKKEILTFLKEGYTYEENTLFVQADAKGGLPFAEDSLDAILVQNFPCLIREALPSLAEAIKSAGSIILINHDSYLHFRWDDICLNLPQNTPYDFAYIEHPQGKYSISIIKKRG